MSTFEFINYEQDGPIVTITLNRPEKLNALSDELMYELGDAFDTIQRDESVRVVVLTGAGRAFSAGYDLSPRDKPLSTIQDWRDHATRAGRDVAMKMWDLRTPVITAVNGYALGGGCDLVLASDITIMADTVQLGEPEVRMVSAPPFLFMPWVIGIKKSKELLFTGDMIDAEEAYRLGIANKVVPADELMNEALSLARRLAVIPPISLEMNKRGVNHTYEVMGLKSAVDYSVEIFTMLLNTMESAEFGQLVAEKGLKAALAERDEAFEE